MVLEKKRLNRLQLMTLPIIRTNTFRYGGSAANLIRDPENIYSNDHDSQEVFLYITDPTADFAVTADVWVLGTETDKISANLSWYLNNSNSAEDTADPSFQMSAKECYQLR